METARYPLEITCHSVKVNRAGTTRQRRPALTVNRSGRTTVADRSILTPELLRQLLRYDPDTGKLYWLPRPESMFPNTRAWRTWNTRFANTLALNALMSTDHSSGGYRIGAVLYRMVKAHRAAWAIHYGVWPDIIDHIDGDRENNRIDNLRSVSPAVNATNTRIRSDNSSTATGVYKTGNRWTAQYRRGKTVHIGTFGTFEEAVAARKVASAANGFHPNHGRQK